MPELKYSYIDEKTGNKVYLMMGPPFGYVAYRILLSATGLFNSARFEQELHKTIATARLRLENMLLAPRTGAPHQYTLQLDAYGDYCGNPEYLCDLISNTGCGVTKVQVSAAQEFDAPDDEGDCTTH